MRIFKIYFLSMSVLYLSLAAQAASSTNKSYVSVFGWNGDRDAAIAYSDGSFDIRDGKNISVGFKISENLTSLKWYNHSGYLPCLVTEFEQNGLNIKIMNFADEVILDGYRYVIAYSRAQVTNITAHEIKLDLGPSPQFISLSTTSNMIAPSKVQSFDFAIAIDRFGQSVAWPENSKVVSAGSWDQHFSHMKNYWDQRLNEIVQIKTPNNDINDSIKAGFIYTHIIKDGDILNVGENGYDVEYDHDAIGISATLLTLGDFNEARAILDHMTTGHQYPDATWKYSWPWAIYLLKIGDKEWVLQHWNKIQQAAHQIAADRTGTSGIMKATFAIDNTGFWTVDNWSALTGLQAYRYLAKQLDNLDEELWAAKEYESLLQSFNQVIIQTMHKYGLTYIPISPFESNDVNRAKDATDANWASFLQFGRWAWDGWLMGANQEGINLDAIDATYAHGFHRLEKAGVEKGNFGSYPGFTNGYNAGYAASALRGRYFRTAGIEAYEFLLKNAQSGPYSWWETILSPTPTNWMGRHPGSGVGSCPHMWGQAQNTKVVLDSLISEFFDGPVMIGRGIPTSWLDTGGTPIEIRNFPLQNNKRMGFSLRTLAPSTFELILSGDEPADGILLSLPIFLERKIIATSAGIIDAAEGVVRLPSSTRSVVVHLDNRSY